MDKTEFGIVGLGVMGKSLSLNMAEKGFKISVYNRSGGDEVQVVSDFIKENQKGYTILGFTDLQEFVMSLKQPRKILLMVKAGDVVDRVIEQLIPLLSKEDIIIDGGNSYFKDTQKRFEALKDSLIHFIGCGISGGKEGARKGPSIMPGGSMGSYKKVANILESIAAKDNDGKPCCVYVGDDGAGHFIKMVHNGIEYAEMQLLAELYALMSKTMDNEAIAKVFFNWSQGDLSGYLIEITIDILKKKEGKSYLLDVILDSAGNKGTGNWSSKEALDLGIPASLMVSAVFARYLSSFKQERVQLSAQLGLKRDITQKLDIGILERAYRFARIINHHQGFQLIAEASKNYGWQINFPEIARIWTNGCIIKSQFMEDIATYFKTTPSLLSNKHIFEILKSSEASCLDALQYALANRIPSDGFWTAYNYWIGMTTAQLPANLIQAQRDYFGAHTYKRKDKPLGLSFHSNWKTS
ncbi:NADP-dependent phosphogluconate dehydrogenase [Aestuariivivens sp. NBU2969]|uniref:NADP-dependent phosphogluconate dehydrogenase n=1 Tax=Aestuariivivens sp. NBU2969 TaxID=2873267 RepID=UPI001CBE7FB1|nr:NADP-dependent phosphogluconate dehydrogenase [Aestuariivivens sp. NBU2969]